MMLDLSQLFPTFLTLLRIPDPRSWLARISSSALVNVLRISFLPTSHVRGLSVAAARQSILGPDHHSHSDNQILVGDDKSDLLKTRTPNPPHLGNDKCSTQSRIPLEAAPTMTQLYTDNDDSSGKSLNPAHA
jgi:hypothetical protein